MLKRYGAFGVLKLIFSLLYTKLFFPRARIIRLPFDIRNRSLINLGKGLTTGVGCRIEAVDFKMHVKTASVTFGNNVQINDYVHIAGGQLVTIGNDVLIASKVFITDINHGIYKNTEPDDPFSIPNNRKLSTDPVSIGDNVWIGESVCVMPGVSIGAGSIIGAGAVVTKSIPLNCIAVGNPAKVIKVFNTETRQWDSVNKSI